MNDNFQLNEISDKLDEISEQLIGVKQVLTSTEAARYLTISKSFLFRLTCERRIPFYRPNGKKIFFSRPELDAWLLSNPIRTRDMISESAERYVRQNPAQ
jgi:excisionase family DNA binding protein